MTCNFKWISKLSLISLVLCMLLVSLVACSVGPTVPTEPSSTSSSTSSSTTSSSATTTVRPSPQYTITFDGNNPAGYIEEVVVFEGQTVTPPTPPQKENATFLGWYLGEEAFDFSTPVNENLELVAKWKENVYYTVTFKDGDTILSTQQVLENTSAKAPEAPQKPGYIFAGWDKAFDKVTSNLVISTTYNVITYTVTFDTVGGTSIPSITVGEGGTVSRPADPVRAGYEFVEWQLAGLPYTFGTPVTCNITLVAVYKSNGT